MTYQPSGSPNLYPSGLSASGISGYLQLAKTPLAAAAEVDLTQICVDTDGEVLMQAWVSSALGLAEIAAGTWSFLVYGNVDTVDGASEIVIRVYSRNAAGSETELFSVTTGDLTGSPAAYTVTSSQAVLALSALTDRLVVKFYAKTSSTGTRTVHLYYLGAARQTRLSLPVELAIVPGGDMMAALYDGDQDGVITASGGHTIQEEGADLPTQTRINFKGAGVTAANNSGTGATDVTIPGGNVDPWITDSNTWSYSSADAPTFVISVNADMTGLIGVGYRIRLTQTTVKYFIVTAVGAYSGGATLITVYGGTDYTLANAAITSPAYSPVKAPLGFPISPAKWTVEVNFTAGFTQNTPTANTWYNATSINIPIGCWRVYYEAIAYISGNTANTYQLYLTLSTANNSQSDVDFSLWLYGNATRIEGSVHREKMLTLAAKATHYLNLMTPSGSVSAIVVLQTTPTILRAVCAYL